MAGVEVGLGEGEVDADGGHVAVAEEELEGEGIATIAEVEDGEGVTEAVGVDVGDASTVSEGDKEFEEAIPGEGLVLVGGDEGAVGGIVGAGGEVFPEGGGGAWGEGEDAFFGAFAGDFEAAVFGVEVQDAGVAELGGAQAGIQEEADEGAGAVGLVGFGGGGVEGAQVGLGEWVDGAVVGFGALDLAHGVGGDEVFQEQPVEEGGKADVVVEAGFCGDGLGGEEGAQDGRGERGYGEITCVF